MKRTGKRVLGFLTLGGATLLAGTAWHARGPIVAAPTTSLASAAQADGGSRRVAAQGRVVAYPGGEVKIGAEWSGRVRSVLVQEGDTVHKGALLAEIDPDELRAALSEARARVVEAEAEATLAAANLERRRRLFDEKIIAVHDLDAAGRDLDVARARRETAAAAVSRYEAQLRKTRLVAPIAGTVTVRRVDTGQMVEVGDDAFTIADLSRLRIEGEAHEADTAAVLLDAPVSITCDGFPGRSWKGRVEEVPDSVTLRRLKPQDPSRPTDTRILAVKVAFAEKTPLRLGTTVELVIGQSAR